MKEKLEVRVGGLAESCSLGGGGGGGRRREGRWEVGTGGRVRWGEESGDQGEGGGEFLRGSGVGTLGKRAFHSPL